jgi:DNA processing protein
MMTTEQILALMTTEGVTRRTVQYVVGNHASLPSSSEDLRNVLEHASRSERWIQVPTTVQLEAGWKNAQRILEQSEEIGVAVLTPAHPKFPALLSHMPDPPMVLYVKGNLESLNTMSVAVVGTRQPSQYGLQMAQRLGAIFAQSGFAVTSGLAIGCDTAAHQGCLSVEGITIAVLGHGLDGVYLTDKLVLAEQILAQEGCLVSEYPPGEKPRRNYFVERDRIQSGLSKAVVVVETDILGGTMHTVRFCLEQRKPVACLWHPAQFADHRMANGNRHLVDCGLASPLASHEDIGNFVAFLASQHG